MLLGTWEVFPNKNCEVLLSMHEWAHDVYPKCHKRDQKLYTKMSQTWPNKILHLKESWQYNFIWSTWNCLKICCPSSVYCSVRNSTTHLRIFILKSFCCRTQFRAKSQTLIVTVMNFILDLTKNLIFKVLYVLTPTWSTIINQNFLIPCLHHSKVKFSTFFVTNITLQCAMFVRLHIPIGWLRNKSKKYHLNPEIYKGDPRTCPIFIPTWGSNWGFFGFSPNQNNRDLGNEYVACIYCGLTVIINTRKIPQDAKRSWTHLFCFVFS